jgi:hypothetical protein
MLIILTSSDPYWTMTDPNLGLGKSGPAVQVFEAES